MAIFEPDSEQSAREFEKLSKFKSTHAPADKKDSEPAVQLDRITYAEMLAPFDTSEDFSTCSMLRDKGDNLTTERLMRLQPEQVVDQILAKAGVLSFGKIMEMLADILMLKKLPQPDEKDLLNQILKKSYALQEQHCFVAKSELCYGREAKRQIALRDFVIECLAKAREPVPLCTLLEATKTTF